MNLLDVANEIGDALESIPGLRVYRHPVDAITPPAAIIQMPTMNYDQAFQRGLDRWDGGIAVLVSSVWDRAAFVNIAAYVDAGSSDSIHGALRARTQADAWTTCAYARATRCTFPAGGYEMNGINYVAAQIDLDIAGTG